MHQTAAAVVFILSMGSAVAVSAAEGEDPHAHHHHAMPAASDLKIKNIQYTVPPVSQVRDDGKKVSFADELNDGRPVVLNFIYTTCTAICPITSSIFAQLQDRLGADRVKVHLVSVSIDPEQDTPARLREYATRFAADQNWNHYTGTAEASLSIQRAFDVYRGDKMRHDPVSFIRIKPLKDLPRPTNCSSSTRISSRPSDANTARTPPIHARGIARPAPVVCDYAIGGRHGVGGRQARGHSQ
jgi:protein SCO1/2